MTKSITITKNTKREVVQRLGEQNIEKIFKLAEVYHSENIEKVYKRLIIMVGNKEENYVKTLIEVMSSWIIEKIDNYNSSMYYENPSYIYACYIEGKIL